MYSARPRKPEQLSREEWCRQHRTGHLFGVFAPGERLRCPHPRRLNNGVMRTCGGDLGGSPMSCRETVVCAILGRPPIPNSDMHQLTCDACRKGVEIYNVHHAELKATG
jgi:hypothetical protein